MGRTVEVPEIISPLDVHKLWQLVEFRHFNNLPMSVVGIMVSSSRAPLFPSASV
jgi:hypothetical protein